MGLQTGRKPGSSREIIFAVFQRFDVMCLWLIWGMCVYTGPVYMRVYLFINIIKLSRYRCNETKFTELCVAYALGVERAVTNSSS